MSMPSRKEMLEEFLAADPDDSFSRYALALELEKAGDVRAAIAQLREVIRRDEKYVAAYYHLGRLLSKAGDEEEALAAYRRGLEMAAEVGDQKTGKEIREAIDLLA
jgi:predicted Zn-dependent protease